MPLPAAQLLPPAMPHIFTRCAPVGAEPEMDYLCVPTACGIYKALPTLGWIDVSIAHPGQAAAPALALQCVLGAPMHLDWGTVAADAAMKMPELTTTISLAAMGRFADAQEGLGIFAQIYTSSQAHLDALEVALPRAPSPSPFLLGPGDLVIASAFVAIAVAAIAPIAAVAAMPAIAAVAAVAAVAGVAAVPGVPAQAAVAAVRARGTRAAAAAVAAVPAVPAVRARAAVAAVLAVAARPAVPAVVAVPGRAAVAGGSPAELEWFHLLKLSARADESSVFPFLAFLRTGLVMLDRGSQVARADPNSLVREVVDSLRAGTLAHSGAATLGNAALARHFPAFALTMDLLPTALRSHSFDAVALGRELVDSITFVGDQAKQDAVTASRLHLIGREFPSVHDLLSRAAGSAAKVSAVRSLSPLGTGYRAGCSLFECLDVLDVLLLKHAPFLTQSWNNGLTVVEVVRLLKTSEAEWKATGDSGATRGGDESEPTGLSRAPVSLRGVTDAALRRAIQDAAFLAVAEEIDALDLETNEGRSQALESALLSGLPIFQRFFANPTCLTTRHAVFASLTVCLSELPAYFGRAQAVDLMTNTIPELRDSWLFHQTDKLFKGRLSELSWFSSPHGALGLMNLDASEAFEDCPIDQQYIVESVLEETIPFVRATMNAAGWSAESKAGYTLVALFERQLAHVRWIRKQGEMEIATLLPHAQQAFAAALLECDAAQGRMLAHPEPAAARLDFHLAFGGTYDKALSAKTTGAAPIIHMRRAFPNLLPPSTPRSLVGVQLTAAQPAAQLGGVGGGGGGRGKGRGGDGGGRGGGGGGRGGDDKGGGAKAPGSLKGLTSWPDATHMRLGALVYDTGAIAKHYSLASDHCFPVLLSTKKGGHALALCAHWGEPGHTSLTSEKHVAPKSWNFTHVCDHMAVKAPASQPGSGAGQKRKAAK